ncbi:MAG: helix-turn-helix transcriptional regulator [Acidimicrobiia bacterium]|nr:helix-turn-helix transcriptional regulator [Acidimicrobiia bacterium]
MLVHDLLLLIRQHLTRRIRSGEITERGLARKTGLSQSHLHNVLKGARGMTPEVADKILRHMRVSILDLLVDESGELVVRKGPGSEIRSQLDSRTASKYVSKT